MTSEVRLKPYKMLDAWRGFAALWVVMYHMALVIVKQHEGHHNLSAKPVYAFSLLGGLGVQIFFVISGYCIINAAIKNLARGEGPRVFFTARIRRIYPPCWAALVFAAMFSLIAQKLMEKGQIGPSVTAENGVLHRTPFFFFANATLTQAVLHVPSLLAQTWTLCYEVAFYGVVGFLMCLVFFKRERSLLNALHALTCLILTLLVIVPASIHYPLDLWPEFGFGILVYDWLTHPKSMTPKVFAAAFGILVVIFTSAHSFPIGTMQESSRSTFLFSLVFAAALVPLHQYDSYLGSLRPVRFFAGVGIFSYSLYLTHTFSIGIVNQAIKKFHFPESLDLLAFFMVILGAVVFARVFHHFFERPFMGANNRPQRASMPVAQTAEAPVLLSAVSEEQPA